MNESDLDLMLDIAAVLYPDHPEDRAVLAARLALYPTGCKVSERDGELVGYAISHPWVSGQPPSLNAVLRALPPTPNVYYLHDIAITPSAQGKGAANAVVAELLAHAAASRFRAAELVAVNDSRAFWRRHGFTVVAGTAFTKKLASYGTDAVYMRRALA